MSSGFVSGGTADKPLERDDEWRKAQQEIEGRRRQQQESRQDGEKSLYEILQNNKAAKEEAFQESIKLKNQFRNLDEDEVEFLDSVLESTRAKEEAVKKETSEQLELFRRQQEEANRGLLDGSEDREDTAGSPTGPSGEAQWAVSTKKRKRLKDEKASKVPKLRKFSTSKVGPQSKLAETNPTASTDAKSKSNTMAASRDVSSSALDPSNTEQTSSSTLASNRTPATFPKSGSAAATNEHSLQGLGLANYSSDED